MASGGKQYRNFLIEKLFEEQPRVMNSEADPFEVSDNETMVKYLKSLQ